MTTLIEFLEARLREDQEAAEAAQDLMESSWQMLPEGPDEENYSGEFRIFNGLTIAGHVEEAKARHIVLHQPAHVLREVAAKRALIELYESSERSAEGVCRDDSDVYYALAMEEAVRIMATSYSDHKDFRPEWAE
jgi:hypothetical protein